MLELLCRLQAISSFAKDCHYHFNEYSQHLLADVNEDDLEEQIDLINEVCYLGQGEEAPAKKDILAGALDYMAQPSNDEKENFAKLKLMIKECLVHLEQTEAKTRGANALLDNIAMTLQQLHGLLFKTVDDAKDIEYLNSLPDLMEEENYNESDEEKGEWITVRGTHIFVKDGESKKEAVNKFLDKKGSGEKRVETREERESRERETEKKFREERERKAQEEKNKTPEQKRKDLKDEIAEYESMLKRAKGTLAEKDIQKALEKSKSELAKLEESPKQRLYREHKEKEEELDRIHAIGDQKTASKKDIKKYYSMYGNKEKAARLLVDSGYAGNKREAEQMIRDEAWEM